MPHIVVEYTPNLDLDAPKLLADLHHNFAAQDTVDINGLKTRAIPLERAIVGASETEGKMVHIMAIMLPGRPDDLRKKMAQDLQSVARTHLPAADISITVETIELHAESYIK